MSAQEPPQGAGRSRELAGAEAAMHRAAKRARQRHLDQVRTSAVASRHRRIEPVVSDGRYLSGAPGLAGAVERAVDTSGWIAERLNGVRLPDLPDNTRARLAAGCWHLAIEHGQAIAELVAVGLPGAALALHRPAIAAAARGCWLRRAAAEAQIAEAGRGLFPPTGVMLDAAIAIGQEDTSRCAERACIGALSAAWRDLDRDGTREDASRPISLRPSADGVRAVYRRAAIRQALYCAEMAQLLSGVHLAAMARDAPLRDAMRARLQAVRPPAAGGA